MTHHFTIISIVTTRRTITFNKQFEIQENIHSAIYTMYLKLKHLRSNGLLAFKMNKCGGFILSINNYNCFVFIVVVVVFYCLCVFFFNISVKGAK